MRLVVVLVGDTDARGAVSQSDAAALRAWAVLDGLTFLGAECGAREVRGTHRGVAIRSGAIDAGARRVAVAAFTGRASEIHLLGIGEAARVTVGGFTRCQGEREASGDQGQRKVTQQVAHSSPQTLRRKS